MLTIEITTRFHPILEAPRHVLLSDAAFIVFNAFRMDEKWIYRLNDHQFAELLLHVATDGRPALVLFNGHHWIVEILHYANVRFPLSCSAGEFALIPAKNIPHQ